MQSTFSHHVLNACTNLLLLHAADHGLYILAAKHIKGEHRGLFCIDHAARSQCKDGVLEYGICHYNSCLNQHILSRHA